MFSLRWAAAGLLSPQVTSHTHTRAAVGPELLWGLSSRTEAFNDQNHFDFTDRDRPAADSLDPPDSTGPGPGQTRTPVWMHKYESCWLNWSELHTEPRRVPAARLGSARLWAGRRLQLHLESFWAKKTELTRNFTRPDGGCEWEHASEFCANDGAQTWERKWERNLRTAPRAPRRSCGQAVRAAEQPERGAAGTECRCPRTHTHTHTPQQPHKHADCAWKESHGARRGRNRRAGLNNLISEVWSRPPPPCAAERKTEWERSCRL